MPPDGSGDKTGKKETQGESGIDWLTRELIGRLTPSFEPRDFIRLKVEVPPIGRGPKSAKPETSLFVVRKLTSHEQASIDASIKKGHKFVAYSEGPLRVARTASTALGALTAAEQELRRRLFPVRRIREEPKLDGKGDAAEAKRNGRSQR